MHEKLLCSCFIGGLCGGLCGGLWAASGRPLGGLCEKQLRQSVWTCVCALEVSSRGFTLRYMNGQLHEGYTNLLKFNH